MDALSGATMFISIGTSGEVYPAANFLDIAHQVGAQTMEFNLEPSARSNAFGQSMIGPAEDTFPAFVEELIG